MYHLKRRGLGWQHRVNHFLNLIHVKQNLNIFSNIFVKQMVYWIFATLSTNFRFFSFQARRLCTKMCSKHRLIPAMAGCPIILNLMNGSWWGVGTPFVYIWSWEAWGWFFPGELYPVLLLASCNPTLLTLLKFNYHDVQYYKFPPIHLTAILVITMIKPQIRKTTSNAM